MSFILNGQSLMLGTCYYPEHWPRALWTSDLQRMLENGIRVIRIAEFAWNKFEPEEGRYTFDFFDDFMKEVEKTPIKVIFCTPTATPPAWLTHKYPEVLNARIDGTLLRHGSRRHYNYNSPVYLEFCRKITEQLGSHYGSHPSIIGWQLDNELNCEANEFYSESDSIAFRDFLREKYGTLNALNDAWGTVFWNQTYTGWEEIAVPQPTPTGSVNPHRELDYRRFISASARRFAKIQSDILRKHIKKDDFITTNGLFGNLDNHAMTAESLDFITYDSYPNFAYCLDDYDENDVLKDRAWSRNLSEARSASPVFGIMEQQSGANGWNTRMEACTPRPGQLTLWTMQSIAHGADYVSYFRWRTCTVGTEIYWHGILDYSGRENRRLREVRSVSEKLTHLQEVSGAKYTAKTALLKDYDNIWDAAVDRWHGRVEQVSQNGIFTAAQLTHTPLDFVYLTEQTTAEALAQYDLIFYPHASILTPARMAVLEQYVENGGTLVMGCRTGYKDLNGRCIMDCLPGLAAKLTGTDIPEYSFVAPDEGRICASWDKTEIEAAVFNDVLAPLNDGSEVLARYLSGDYAGQPALIRNRFGKGYAFYFGGAFSADTAKVFLEKLGAAEPFSAYVTAPEGCEIAVRQKDGVTYLFVLNYLKTPVSITLHRNGFDLISQTSVSGDAELAGYEAKVYRFC